ncbi:MAG TPA: HU family DNA-binding protein [Bryobacteraceae bacterium]|jgi:nucleoid DNA-binding protein|nr:HU family DNA-binding protein [Bryobacteraceae bacterium]
MKKSELATRLAKQVGVSPAEAADQLDHVVSQIISNLKKGQGAQLPGLGEFKPGAKWNFKFEPKGSARRGKR